MAELRGRQGATVEKSKRTAADCDSSARLRLAMRHLYFRDWEEMAL
jgi:hypothetical protein